MKLQLSRSPEQEKGKQSLGRLVLALVVLALALWQQDSSLRPAHAQARAGLVFSSPRQYSASYRGSTRALATMGGHPFALSMAAGDLDGDAIGDLAIGFAAPRGGVIAIHHGNLDAFAPQSDASFWAIARGDFPSPYLPQADVVEIPTRPDLLAEGDLIGPKGSALAAAALGGSSIVVLSRNDAGVMQVQQTLTVQGTITAMDVHDLARAKFASLVVGVHTAGGAQLLIFTGSHAGLSQTGNFPLAADATSFASGDLDGDGIPDLLVVAGGQVSIVHSGTGSLETVSTPFTVSRAALGGFLQDRSPVQQMALLGSDGTLHIMARNGFDPTPYTFQELQAFRLSRIARRLHHPLAAQTATVPAVSAPKQPITWNEVERTSSAGGPDASGRMPLLFRSRVSNNGADDVMLMSSAKLSVLAHPTSQPNQIEMHDRSDLGADVVAAAAVRVNVDSRPGLVYLAKGQSFPIVISLQANNTFTVNTTSDFVSGNSSACLNAVSGQCSLREAIVESNAAGSGTDTIMVPNGTYTLTIARAGSPAYDAKTGTLDVTQSVNIIGGGQSTAIIQAGTKGVNDSGGPNGVDKVFSFNQDILAFTNATVSVSTLTIQNGFNKGNVTSTFDGWGGAFDCDTGTNGTANVTLTNVTLNNNTLSEGEGGGFAEFNDVTTAGTPGKVTVTNGIISNNVTQVSTAGELGGGGGIAVEDAAFLTMSNSTVSGNKANKQSNGSGLASGGGIEDVGSGLDETGHNFINNQVTLHGVTITSNTASLLGGGFESSGGGLTIDQESVISNNTSAGDGGGLQVGIYSNNAHSSFATTFSNIAVTGNTATAGGATAFGGGIKINGGLLGQTGFTMHFSRISGNTATSGDGQQFSWQSVSGATINVTENWWGTNSDPKTAAAITFDPTGATGATLTYLPYVVLTYSPSPTTVKINTTSTLTADVAHDSSGATAALSGNLAAFNNLPVTFSSGTGGSITTAQPVALPSSGSGSITSTFTAGGAGATVSTGAVFDGVTVNANIIVLQTPSISMGFIPATVAPNVASTLTFNVTNGNTVTIDSNFTDTLPTNMKVAPTPTVVNNCGGTVTATAGASSISWTNATLAVGTCTIKVNLIGTVDNTYTDGTTINSTAAGNGNSPSTNLTVINPPAMAKAFSPATIPVGSVSTLTLTLTSSNSNLTLSGVQFTDTLPTGMTVASPANLSTTCGGTPGQTSGTVTLSSSSLAPGASCTVTVSVTASTAGTLNNSVTPTSTNGGTASAANAALTAVAQPTISKSFTPSGIALNGSSALSFTITNPNASATLHGVAFSDTFPTGMSVATPNGLTGSCGGGTITATAGSGSVTLSGAALAGTASCTFSVNVQGTVGGALVNTTSAVTSTESGNGLTASATLNVEGPPSIAKSFSPAGIAVSGTTSLTFTITNPAGNLSSLTGVAFSDTLPTGLTVTSATSSHCGGTLTVTAPVTISLASATVAVGTPCTFSVTVTGASAGSYTNTTGSVTSTNGGTGNTASAGLTVATPPSIAKSFSPTSVPLGGASTLTLSITNPNSSVALAGVAFTDTFPGGMVLSSTPGATNTCGGTLTATGGTGLVSLSGGSIPASGSCAVSVAVQGNTAGALPNSVQVTSTTAGNGNTANATLTVVAPPTFSKSFGAPTIALNATTSLTFSITNINASTTLHGLGFTDNFPTGMSVATPNGLTGSCGGGAITATAGSSSVALSGAALAPGTPCAFSVNVNGTTGGVLTNTTSAITSTESGNGLTASAALNVEAPPSIAESFSPAGIALSGTSSLTFTITNPAGNPASLTGVAFTDTLPTGLTVISATSAHCGGTLTVTAPVTISLASATVAVGTPCTFSVTVTGASAGSYTNTTGNVTSTNGGTGNTATAPLTVASPPSIANTFVPTSVPVGGVSTSTLTITNPNPAVALSGVAFTDTFPGGMVLSSTPGATNTCGGALTATGGAGSVSLSGGSIAANGSCAVSVAVQGNTAGALNNSVQVTSTTAGNGNTANATLTVVAPPTFSKSFGAPTIALNATTSLTFSITNINASTTLHGLGFTDNFPTGMSVATPNGLTGSCGGGAITATAGSSSVALSGAALAPGTPCAFSVNVTGAVGGVLSNTTSAITSTESGNGLTASATLNVEAPPSIAKSFSPAGIALGGSTSLTFTITNPAGNLASLTGVAFSDTLPTGLTVTSATSAHCGGTLTVTAPVTIALASATVAVGTPCTFSVTVTGATTGNYTNTTGNVTSTNGGTGNTATAPLAVATPPSIANTFAPTSVPVGGVSTSTLTITNPNAAVALSGLAFTDTFPGGLALASSPGATNTCGGTLTATGGAGSVGLSGGSIAANGSCAVSVAVQSSTGGALNNSVLVTSSVGNGNSSNATLTAVTPPTITKSFGASPIALNATTSLSFTITNTNASTTLHGVGFTDNFPAGMSVATPNGLTGSCGGGTITATAGSSSVALSSATLANGASCAFSVNVTGTLGGALTNTTSAVTSTESGNGLTASASLSVEAPPSIAKSFAPGNIMVGGSTNLTFTITNPAGNPASLTGVAFTDTLPTGLTVAGATSSPCGGTLTVTAPMTIALAGSTVAVGTPCTFSVSVTGASVGSYTNFTGSVTSTNGGTGNIATANLTVAAFSLCDLNHDGSVSVGDLQTFINQALGVASPVGDLNGDGVVNAVDLQIAVNAVLGLGCSAT